MTKKVRDFIIQQLAQWTSTKSIHEKLVDIHEWDRDIEATKELCKKVKSKYASEIMTAREKFLADFSDLPLAYSPMRVRLLSAFYNQATDEGIKRQILKQIKDEMGGYIPQATPPTPDGVLTEVDDILKNE